MKKQSNSNTVLWQTLLLSERRQICIKFAEH